MDSRQLSRLINRRAFGAAFCAGSRMAMGLTPDTLQMEGYGVSRISNEYS